MMMVRKAAIDALYDELWFHALSYVGARDALTVSTTCRGRLRDLARDEVVWSALYASRFATPSGLQCDETLETFCEKYRQRVRHPKPGDCACLRRPPSSRRRGSAAPRAGRSRGRVGRVLRARARQGLHGPVLVVLRRPRGRTLHGPLPWLAGRARAAASPAEGRNEGRREEGKEDGKRAVARRWDEVVDRSCLRWPVSEGASAALRRGDVVEVYCRGTSVPGSWLDSRAGKG